MISIPVLANGRAGAKEGLDQRRVAIERAFEAAGATAHVAFVAGDEMEAAARGAVAGGAGRVVAAGGDGTVGAVAAAVAGTGTALAVLPLGTLNHFARDAGIPLGLDDAARVAVNGAVEPVDVAEVNGRVFINNASIGVYPRAVRERHRRGASAGTWTKRLATLQVAWAVLQRLPAHHVLLEIDGRAVVRTTSFVFVGNNLYETGFGRLGRRDSLRGGLLGVYHSLRPGRRAVVCLAARALVGRLDGATDLQAQEARELTIRSARTSLPVALDGEVVHLDLPLRFRTRPGDLLILRPGG